MKFVLTVPDTYNTYLPLGELHCRYGLMCVTALIADDIERQNGRRHRLDRRPTSRFGVILTSLIERDYLIKSTRYCQREGLEQRSSGLAASGMFYIVGSSRSTLTFP